MMTVGRLQLGLTKSYYTKKFAKGFGQDFLPYLAPLPKFMVKILFEGEMIALKNKGLTKGCWKTVTEFNHPDLENALDMLLVGKA